MCNTTTLVLRPIIMSVLMIVMSTFFSIQLNAQNDCVQINEAIQGPENVCSASIQMYCVDANGVDGVFTWNVSEGGEIVGASDENCVMIEWIGDPGSLEIISVVEEDDAACYEYLAIDVFLGQSVGDMSCLSFINVSLSEVCELHVTAEMLLTSDFDPNGAYDVMLTDEDGNLIEGDVLTGAHIGQDITGKVIDVCTSNSCWSTITVEDKMAPIIECVDTIVNCLYMGDYPGPIIWDNCTEVFVTLLNETETTLNCDPLFTHEIIRTYIAEDAYGNISNQCDQTILVARVVLDAIEYDLIEDFASTLWEATTEGSGSINMANEPFEVSFISSNNGVHDLSHGTDLCIDIPYFTTINFDWAFSSNNGSPFWDPFGYRINGVFYQLTNDGGGLVQNGTASVVVNEGDVFCFSQETIDAIFGAGNTTISNFNYNQRSGNIEFPADRSIEQGTALTCNSYEVDEEGHPHPSETGVPFIDGKDLFPYVDDFCNMGTGYIDTEIPSSDCAQKIMREWTIFESWCSDAVIRQHIQIIHIADQEVPEIVCPEELTLTTNGSTCEASFIPELPVVSDDCSELMEIDLAYPGGFIDDFQGTEEITLAGGVHVLNYTVYDACLNSASCEMTVIIEDNTPPIAVCDQNTSLSLNVDGYSYAYASVFDDGSFDDCGAVTLQVRRMDNGSACGYSNFSFGDYVEFCCSDVGEETTIIMRVIDEQGLVNECMVNVDVQDKNPPSMVCPADVTIACDYDLDLEDLSEFGFATASDNCMIGDISVSVVDNITECNVGTVERIFSVSDANGATSCIQTITLINDTPFDGSITWPLDYITDESCDVEGLLPDDLLPPYNYPSYTEDVCDQVSVSFSDLTFPIEDENNSCFKILRSWEVKDFCQPEGNDYAVWYHDQIIMVVNTIDPIITSSCDFIEACTNVNDCDFGFINLTAEASDDCTPDGQIQWSYAVDLNGDGIYDAVSSGSGNSIDASGDYPIGDHTVLYSFEDKCGNVTTCAQDFSIIDCNGPTASCMQSISVAIEPMDLDGDGIPDIEMACISASVFNASSSHPCDVPLTFSFSEDIADSILCVECCDIGLIDIELWVTDTFGNNDFCLTVLEVQDNNGQDYCPDGFECITWGDDILVDYVVPDLLPETIGGAPVIDPDCDFQIYTINYIDTDVSNPNDACTTIQREWEVHFICGLNGNGYTHYDAQIITQLNGSDPILTCPSNITVPGDEIDCDEYVIVPVPDFGPCSFGVTFVNNSPFADSPFGAASGDYPVGTVTVTYTGTDASGNSSTCTVDVTVTDETDPIALCQNISVILDGNGNIAIVGQDVDGGSFDDCTSIVNYSVVPNTFNCNDLGANNVVLTVTDENGNMATCDAIVSVSDTLAPVCITQDLSITLLNTNPVVVPASFYDNGSFDPCGDIVSITADNESWDCDDIGVNVVTLTLTDDSGNVTTCTANLTIDEMVDPTCVPLDITINLDINDLAIIVATDVDGGSFDDCGMIVQHEVSKDTFDCDDLGDNLVTLTVTDAFGNTSDCVATVTIEPGPSLFCATIDITIDLDENGLASIVPADIDGGSSGACDTPITLSVDPNSFDCDNIGPNTVVLTVSDNSGNSTTCEAVVTIEDNTLPIITCPVDLTVACDTDIVDLSVFGIATATDNCDILVIDELAVVSTNNCGVGIITRTFTAIDENNNSAACVQIINVGDSDDILDETDIVWPLATVESFICGALDSIELFGEPAVFPPTVECSDFSISFSDVDLNPNSICPDSVSRTWTVIDSCEFDGTGAGVFDFVQTLIITDNTAPEFDLPDTIFVECDSILNFIAVATDCNEIDTIFHNSPFSYTNDSGDLSGVYPDDTIVVTITAIDICGNVVNEDIVIAAMGDDITPPEFECKKIIVELNDEGEVTLNAIDLVCLISDNCTDSLDLIVVFQDFWEEGGPLGDTFPTITFMCPDTGNNTVYLAIIDEAGNFTSCITIVTVLDPLDICGNSIIGLVSGDVFTENKFAIGEVTLELIGPEFDFEETDDEGHYAFEDMLYHDEYMSLSPYKEGYPLDGVSTLDLVLIQQHIMGALPLGSPYKIIASDVNQSGHVSLADVLELKKLILGIYDEFSEGLNWRFVDAEYQFINAVNPLEENFPETFESIQFISNIDKDFIAVKLGDVNETIENELISDADNRSQIVAQTNDVFITEGEQVLTTLTLPTDLSCLGYQFEIQIAASRILSISDQAGMLATGEFNFENNILKISRVFNSFELFNAESPFITFTYEANQSGNLSEIFKMQDSGMENQMYSADVEIIDFVLSFNEMMHEDMKPILYQNSPNPWSEQSTIGFELFTAGTVQFNFLDPQGKLMHTTKGVYEAGKHVIDIEKDLFGESGMIIYEMITDDIKLTKRMVLLK